MVFTQSALRLDMHHEGHEEHEEKRREEEFLD
jgi:hypothetical protein